MPPRGPTRCAGRSSWRPRARAPLPRTSTWRTEGCWPRPWRRPRRPSSKSLLGPDKTNSSAYRALRRAANALEINRKKLQKPWKIIENHWKSMKILAFSNDQSSIGMARQPSPGPGSPPPHTGACGGGQRLPSSSSAPSSSQITYYLNSYLIKT